MPKENLSSSRRLRALSFKIRYLNQIMRVKTLSSQLKELRTIHLNKLSKSSSKMNRIQMSVSPDPQFSHQERTTTKSYPPTGEIATIGPNQTQFQLPLPKHMKTQKSPQPKNLRWSSRTSSPRNWRITSS